VTDMRGMFYNAANFNQDLCPWGPKLPSNFDYSNFDDGTYENGMFVRSGCPNKNSPTGRTGPWCAATCT